MSTPEELYPSAFPECRAVARVRATEFHEPHFPGLYAWLRNNAVEGIPLASMGENFDAQKTTSFTLFKMKECAPVVYKPKNLGGVDIGRMYAPNSSQGLWAPIRSAIYVRVQDAVDVDIVNAHPTILSQFCRQLGIPCPVLDLYVAKRDAVLKEVIDACGVERVDAKQLFAMLINLGQVTTWMAKVKTTVMPPVATELRAEAESIAEELIRRFPLLYKATNKSRTKSIPKARFMSYVMGHHENRCMCSAVSTLLDSGRPVYSLIYDGFICGADHSFLPKLNEAVKAQTGFDLGFAIKPFEDPVQVPDNVEMQVDAPNRFELARCIYESDVEAFQNIRFDGVTGSYFQYSGTNWRRVSRASLIALVEGVVNRCKVISGASLKEFWTNGASVCDIIMRSFCLEDNFEQRLDSSMDILPLGNCCYDFKEGGFREIRREDLVRRNAGWHYVPGQSQEWFWSFITTIFPVQEDLRIILTYIAYTLCPVKDQKVLLALTDVNKGNCGKSALVDLFTIILGELSGVPECERLYIEGRNFLLADSNSNKNQHAGSLQNLKGVFLLLADEMSAQMKLDDAFGKDTTGGAGCRITGRGFNSGDLFSFPVKFSQLITFNQNQLPTMNSSGEYYRRLIMAHARAKGLSPAEFEQNKTTGEYEFSFVERARSDIRTEINANLSGILDAVLPYHGNRYELRHPPASFTEFRDEIVRDENPLIGWFERNIVKTGDDRDVVKLQDVDLRIDESGEGRNIKGGPRWKRALFQSCCDLSGVKVHHRFWVAGKRLRRVAVGVRFRQPDEADADDDES